MDTVPGLTEIRERKRELLLESHLNRQVLRVEYGRLRCRAEQYRRGYYWAHGLWRWAAPLAGFLVARRFKKTAGVLAKGSLLAGFLRSAWNLWGTLRNRDPRPDPLTTHGPD